MELVKAPPRRPPEGTPREAADLFNLANRLWRDGRLPEALASYRETLVLAPGLEDAAHNLGNLLLVLGEDEEGWALYQNRPARLNSVARGLGFPEWRGEPLAGKRLFIWAEQGMGDQIFAARYLRGLVSETTLVCAPALSPLLAPLCSQVIPRHDPVSVGPDYDFWTLPLSLPQWSEASAGPYLSAAPRAIGRVGVMWRGNPLPDPKRSLPEVLAQRLLSIPGAVSLQPEDTGARDFCDTAAIIAGLETVITIDTSVAHLTGAMGKRGIVLLQGGAADWRWRPERPWYPSLEMWRQPYADAWEPLVDAAVRLLG